MSVSSFVGLVVGLLGIAGIAGGLVAFFRQNITKSTIETLMKDNGALRGRVDTLEDEDARKKQRIDELEHTTSALRDVIGAGPAITEMTALMTDSFERMFAQLGTVIEKVGVLVERSGA